VGAALGWGALAASSLLIGTLVALVRPWSKRAVGLVLGFGAGALISAVSFELAAEGIDAGGGDSVAIGLTLGAVTFYVADGLVGRLGAGRSRERRSSGAGPGGALALGAFLDGIPEQLVLGLGVAAGDGVSLGLLVAVFVSNLPEAVGSASAMRASGSRAGTIVRLWGAVAVVCALASGVGYAIADSASGNLIGAVNGFAAGALLVMLVDSMIPEATESSGRVTGLVTTLGFAVAAALSAVS
jgi:zinc transporter, ZIP family